MAEEEIDPELIKLLEDIDNVEELVKENSVEENNVEENTQKNENLDNDKIDYEKEAKKSENIVLTPDDNDIEDFNSISDDDDDDDGYDDSDNTFEVEVIKDNKEKEELERDVFGLLKQHCNSASAMFQEADTDRKKIDDIIDILLPKIEGEEYRGADIMALTSLIQTKADISRNRAANMDSIAKLFAALKNNDNIGINGSSDSDAPSQDEIARLLGKKQ